MKNIQSIKMTHRGKKIDVIPVYDTSMRNIIQWNKNALENKVNEELRFERLYQFNKVEKFIEEGRDLVNLITGESVKEFVENMLLFIPTIETTKDFIINRIYIHKTLNIVINDFSVEECFQALAGDEAMASPATNRDHLNWSCEVTKDQLLINVRNHMEHNDIKNISTAFKNFNVIPTMQHIKIGAISGKFPTMEARTPEVAQEIHDTILVKFGKLVADKRFVIDCINKKCAEGYKLSEILTAIKALDLVAIRQISIRGIGCLDKEVCISNEITIKLQELGFKAELKRKAA